MRKIEEITELLFGQGIAEAMIERLLECSADFREDHKRYTEALEQFREVFGDGADIIHAAVLRKCASDLAFAGMLGFKMNIDHYVNPMSPNCTWAQVDYNDYLREDIARSLPEHQEAETVLEDFRRKLPVDMQQYYSAVAEYESHLVTFGPKLAHYYGFLAGNEILWRWIPGYCPDPMLTLRYTEMVERIFEI